MALSKLTDIRKSLSVEIEDLQVNGITTFTGSVSIGGTLTYQDVTNVDSVGIITAQAGISITGGDLTIPDSIIHLGDTNTKIRFPAADTISFETAGSERVRIKSNGYVGINSASPVYPLDVLETTDNSGLISIRGSNDSYDTGFLIRNGPNPKWYLINDVNGTGGHSFEIRGDGWSNDRFLTITQSGDVGIGTDNPTKKLQVFDSSATSTSARANTVARFLSNASNADCNIQLSNGVDHSAQIGIVGNGAEVYIAQDGIERLRITSTGSVGIGTNNPDVGNTAYPVCQVHGTSTNAYFKLTNTTTGVGSGDGVELSLSGSDAYLTNRESANIIFRTGGSNERLRITSTGLIYVGGDATGGRIDATAGDGSMTFSDGNGRQTLKILTMGSGQSTAHIFDANGRLLTGGATTSHGSTNADDLQIGANNQSNQTGITLGSASASSVRFADANDDTAGAVYYGHGDDIMRFYAGSNQRFTVSGTTATASASIMTATIFRSGGPGGGLGITMGGLAAGSGSSWVNTGISVNASNGGRTMMILGSRNTGAGYSTQAYMWLIRFAYDGNNLPSVHNVTGNNSFWSIRVSSSNTLEINGNSGNWQFGGVYVN